MTQSNTNTKTITEVTTSTNDATTDANLFPSLLPRSPVIAFVLTVLTVLTCLLNIIVMICIRVEKKLRGKSYMYIFSLAIADLMVGALVMPAMITYPVYVYWPFGRVMCTIWIILNGSLCTVSTFHLCFIGYDRYMALNHPLVYMAQTKQRVFKFIIFAWVLGELLWVPHVVILRSLDDYPADTYCALIPPPVFVLCHATVIYYIPTIIVVYLYGCCVFKLCVRSNRINATHVPASENQSMTVSITGTSGCSSAAVVRPGDITKAGTLSCISNTTNELISNDSRPTVTLQPDSLKPTMIATLNTTMMSPDSDAAAALSSCNTNMTEPSTSGSQNTAPALAVSGERWAKHIRAVRMVGLIMGMFLFCWGPFFILWPIIAFNPYNISNTVTEYVVWSAYFNSFINPLLYFVSNADFRRAFKRIIKKIISFCTCMN